MLYIADYEAKIEIGCRVLNVLRYYLALVSLLWNAVEAHNMYRMLVKIFHAETSHFVLIAEIFTWGNQKTCIIYDHMIILYHAHDGVDNYGIY